MKHIYIFLLWILQIGFLLCRIPTEMKGGSFMTTRFEQVVEIRRMYKNGVSKADIMRKLNLSRPTVDKYINENNFNDSPPVPESEAEGSCPVCFPQAADNRGGNVRPGGCGKDF